MNRRTFVARSAGTVGVAAIAPGMALESHLAQGTPDAIASLKPLPGAAAPITDDERQARIAKAQRLMAENGISAIFLEGGTSMVYFTGMRWGNSERTFGVVIPAKGELAWVTPGFEEARARELIKFSNDVRVWQEDESPYKVIAQILRDRGAATGKIGFEERVRFFIFDGVRQELPGATFVNATPVTAGCRMIKSPAEIALMQRANDITLAAIGASFKTLKEGMTNQELSANVGAATRKLGGIADGALVIFGKYTAFPHGSVQPQKLQQGDVVLIDAGCTVEGYVSDITRTTVFGKPTQRMRDVWEIEKKAQSAAFAAAKVGAPCGSVDDAARKVITDAGFGPGYKVPGLPHRTGHGIGMDGHEWTNFVRGNMTKIQPGCASATSRRSRATASSGFDSRTACTSRRAGPKFFTPQSPSIEHPV